ncbi:MAG: protein-glutamate O-methyltransferase CheR [Verrucomicrobiota bacterium]
MSVSASDAEAVDFLIALIYERSRIRLHEGKHPLIRARLGKRLRHHGFETLSEYCRYLRQSGDEAEMTQVIDSLTTNYTMFLREREHFDFMIEEALPTILMPHQKQFQIWSSACATGEEPYSLAIYLAENYPLEAGWDWRILATDISTRALSQAMQAVYPAERLQSVPQEWLRRYFQRGQNRWSGYYRVKDFLQARIEFKHLNLLGDYEFGTRFPLIFCRNVMIYFDRATQQQLGRKLCPMLAGQGFLLVGHSESLNGLDLPLRCRRPSIYQKN